MKYENQDEEEFNRIVFEHNAELISVNEGMVFNNMFIWCFTSSKVAELIVCLRQYADSKGVEIKQVLEFKSDGDDDTILNLVYKL